MKIPISPPSYTDLVRSMTEHDVDRFLHIINLNIKSDSGGQYYHWDKLRHLSAIDDLTNEEWWLGIKLARKALYRKIPHSDKLGRPFVYGEPDIVRKLLHEIDIHGGGEIKNSEQVANPHTRDTYLINSLIEEAITSSQLEGAATTRKIAKEMIRQKRKPQDRSERMIVNNYHAMEYINSISNEALTPEIILALHKILLEETMDDSDAIGKLRVSDDIYIGDDRDATIIHIPPTSAQLPERLKSICDFANNTNEDSNFLHPVLKAIILHFLLAYDHPFEDGNGRTARALFYWSMLKQGYWTIEFISISSILKKAPAKYTKAYLHTETDENDVTYFIIHQLETITKAITELFKYFEKKSNELQSIENIIKQSPKIQAFLNHRQIALLNRALKKSDAIFYIKSHQGAHAVTYDTARTDLLKLVGLKLLRKEKMGKTFVFLVEKDLHKRLEGIVETM